MCEASVPNVEPSEDGFVITGSLKMAMEPARISIEPIYYLSGSCSASEKISVET